MYKKDFQKDFDKTPLSSLSQFFYTDVKSLKEWVGEQIKGIKQSIESNKKYVEGLSNSKSDQKSKQMWGDTIKMNEAEIEKLKSEYEKYEQEKSQIEKPKVERSVATEDAQSTTADKKTTQQTENQTETEVGKPPIEGEPVLEDEGESSKVGVTHSALTDLSKKLNLKEPERGEYTTPEQYAERGRKLLNEGANPNEVDNPNNTLHDRISIARAHLENLVRDADNIAKTNPEGVSSKEYQDAWKKINDYTEKVKGLGTEAHRAMTSLQGERDIDTDSFTAVKKNLEEDLGKPPSKEQEQKIAELTEHNQKLKEQADKAEAKLVTETEKAFKEGVEEGKKKSKSEKAKSVADKLRENAKLHKPGSFSAATPASLVWDAAVEIVAKGIEAGGKIADVIDAGLKHIRESDWYKGLNDDKKQIAEKDFKEFHYDNTDSSNLEDLQARFVDKTGNKFTQSEGKSIWDYVKKTYLDNGVSYRDALTRTSDDLGLSWRQISEAVTTKKVRPISDVMWKKQADYRKAQAGTKNWVEAQGKSLPMKALRKVSAAFRGVSVFGHGGIFIGTHAGMTLFNPSQWHVVIPAFIRGWKFAYGNKANYERRIEQLRNSPNYVLAQRAGLKNNPDIVNAEEFQKSQKFFEKVGGEAGVKGFNAIKVLRQDLFDYHYKRLSEVEKNDPEAVKQIARLVNNATGATNLKLPEWVNEVTFAGGMEAARWGKLTRNPARATAIAIKALVTPEKATTAERVFAKVWARRVGEQLGTMTAMLIANAAIQNTLNPNNKTNLTDPNKSDFMKFKFGDLTLDPTSGMRSAFMFIYGLGKVPFMQKKELRGDTRTQAVGKNIATYGRGKLAPFYSTLADFFSQADYNKNPLPFSDDKPTPGHHKLTWGEYAWQKAPLPMAHAAQDMYHSALDNGANKITLDHVIKGVIAGGISGGTGFRVGEYNAEEANHSPFTDADKKDPTFKKWIDRGFELPNTSLSSEEITDEKNKTKKKVSEYPKEKQEKYISTHKQMLKEELKEIEADNRVYVKTYKDNSGDNQYQVSLNKPKGDYERKSLSQLSKEEGAQVLSLAQKEATRRTKEKVFNQ